MKKQKSEETKIQQKKTSLFWGKKGNKHLLLSHDWSHSCYITELSYDKLVHTITRTTCF